MSETKPVVVMPGTFIRMFPERDPEGRHFKDHTWRGKKLYFEGHPVFEVKSFIVDGGGSYVTFERADGTSFVMGGGDIIDKKFAFPHPTLEIVGEEEAAAIRVRRRAWIESNRAQKRPSWLQWLWPRAFEARGA